MEGSPEPSEKARRGVARLAPPILGGLAILLGGLLGPSWLRVWWTGLEPGTRRAVSVGFLLTVLVSYGMGLALATLGATTSLARVLRGRKLRQRRPASARVLLLCVAILFGLAMLEVGAWGLGVWSRMPQGVPKVPPASAPATGSKLGDFAGDPARRDSDDLLLLVLGESSAEGQPYEPWFSIGHVLAWQLEKAVPGRKVRVRMGASGGIPLAHAIQVMQAQTERPDLVLVYSGHNEFQARWGWTRVVNYYDDDIVLRPRDGLADLVGGWTPFCGLIRDAIERQSIDRQPTPKEIRAAVERPVCEPETRANLRDLFERQLETVALWCERAGALPIFVVPAGNDVGFDPDRSVLDRRSTPEERESFARAFAAARAEEAGDPGAAMATYRRLIARQPGFAEGHYRLAKLLQAAGNIAEARGHYALARDLDGLPMRCPGEFQAAYRDVAKRHDLILIDGPARLTELSPTGLLDDHVFHDGQHPTFRAYLDLAQDAMDRLWARGAFGTAKGPAPRLDPAECAAHFGFDAARWALACRRAASFWDRLAAVRYDSAERESRADRNREAAAAIEASLAPEDADVPGLGVRPEGFP